jgi:hypothetical protein
MAEEDKQIEALMRASFEAEIPERLRRASLVRLQNIIPAHWFSAAASECAGMYIAGFFYGAISVTQAYVEALSKYLAEQHKIKVRKDVVERCRRLRDRDVLSAPAFDAATKILNDRNDFHHLNKDVEQDFRKLEERAAECINLLHSLESEVFAYSYTAETPGQVVLSKPEYWPSPAPGQAHVHLRQLW